MAGATLLTLLDDIATILDDVATMSKVAVEKTAGVLGDDLALNAQQVSGVDPARELPVVWAVAKGSLVNKAILVPAAILFSTLLPSAVKPLLMIGGIYLCFEGTEKIVHRWFAAWFSHTDSQAHSHDDTASIPKATDQATDDQSQESQIANLKQPSEKQKIMGAIRTDFVLSAEIIVIAMGTFPQATLSMRTMVLVVVALLMTVGVYGLVAAIVKLDDLGYHFLRSRGQDWSSEFRRRSGRAILGFAPKLLRFLAVAGTVAMFLVGGHIILEGVPVFHHWHENIAHWLRGRVWFAELWSWLAGAILSIAIGLAAGLFALVIYESARKLFTKRSKLHS